MPANIGSRNLVNVLFSSVLAVRSGQARRPAETEVRPSVYTSEISQRERERFFLFIPGHRTALQPRDREPDNNAMLAILHIILRGSINAFNALGK